MNTEDITLTKGKAEAPVEEPKKEETPEIGQPKQGWFFPNVAEGLPFGIEAASREEAEAANKHYLESQKKESK